MLVASLCPLAVLPQVGCLVSEPCFISGLLVAVSWPACPRASAVMCKVCITGGTGAEMRHRISVQWAIRDLEEECKSKFVICFVPQVNVAGGWVLEGTAEKVVWIARSLGLRATSTDINGKKSGGCESEGWICYGSILELCSQQIKSKMPSVAMSQQVISSISSQHFFPSILKPYFIPKSE